MNSAKEKVLVQMRLNKSTIGKIKDLTRLTDITNRTQLVSQAIAIYHIIVKAEKEKGIVYLEYPDNRREKLVVVR